MSVSIWELSQNAGLALLELHCWGHQSLKLELVVVRSLVLLHRACFGVSVPSTAADRHCGHNRLELCMWERDSVTISVLCCNQVRLAYQSPGKPALVLVTACLMGMGISLSLLRLSWCFFLFQQRQT